MTLFGFGRKPKRRKSAPDEIPQASQQTQRPSPRNHRRRFGSLPAHLLPSATVAAPQGPGLQQTSPPAHPQPAHSYTYPSPYMHSHANTYQDPYSHCGPSPAAPTALPFASQSRVQAQNQQQLGQWELSARLPPAPPIPQAPYQNPYHTGASISQPYLPVAGAASPQVLDQHHPYQPYQQHYQHNHQNDGRHKSKWKSTANLLQLAPPKVVGADVVASAAQLQQKTNAYLNQGAVLCDLIASKLDAIVTSIDGDLFSGEESDLVIHVNNAISTPAKQAVGLQKVVTRAVGCPDGRTSTNYFSKVWLYSNSRLPPHLPPFKVYMPTYPLLCLAARYSERVYNRPTGPEKEAHIGADWRSGAKAMVLKSVPIDDMNTIVLAIRGSQTFMDWTVNFRPAPSSPAGFLEDPGNLCHSGFLNVARAMITPVAARLRALLDENPARANRSCSLVITGHSAGGAVAALLYAHMMTSVSSAANDNNNYNANAANHPSSRIQSPLTALTSSFKRVHCITFGAPPVSLLPLRAPEAARRKKSMFFAFINEGDPVARADKTVVASLLKLYAAPAPAPSTAMSAATGKGTGLAAQVGMPLWGKQRERRGSKERNARKQRQRLPEWHVPPSTLSNAGRLVLLRESPGGDGHHHRKRSTLNQHSRTNNGRAKSSPAGPGDGRGRSHGERGSSDKIEACIVTDEQVRSVVFGDPVYHMMSLYARRIEALAMRAVTVRDFG